jgi:3D-(3,5/4)-trihydroxycyclohexane-1,2-dione acylhydrolase (decyclizing)
MRTLTDPANCGPVTLAFCQDVQAESFAYPESFFEPKVWRIRRPEPDPVEVEEVVKMIKAAKKPVILSGGGVLYSGAEDLLADFALRHNIPLVETQAGRGALDWEHEMNYGSPGVTGSDCANEVCEGADLVIGVGTRFQDFTTGSWTVFANPHRKLVSINLHSYDAQKHGAVGVVGDARLTLEKVAAAVGDVRFDAAKLNARAAWHTTGAKVTAPPTKQAANALPADAQVIGAVQRVATKNTVVTCAAGTMPGLCKSCGSRPRAAITWSTAIPAWATRWLARWASSSPRPKRK